MIYSGFSVDDPVLDRWASIETTDIGVPSTSSQSVRALRSVYLLVYPGNRKLNVHNLISNSFLSFVNRIKGFLDQVTI